VCTLGCVELARLEVVQIRLLDAAETLEQILFGERLDAEPAHSVDGLLVRGPQVERAAVSDRGRSESQSN
jgi:hypothetical protein